MWKFKDFGSSLENAFGTYSETEILVREATCEQPWGPTHKQMEYLCDLCDGEPDYSELMNMLWFRITYAPQKSWRRVYKGLLILDFLIKHGPVKVIHDVVENLNYLDQIKLYQYLDEDNNDKTINIKHRANEIRSLVEDHSRLRKERKSMLNLRAKMNESSNGCSKKMDKSLAIKTKTFISDIVERVSSNNSPVNNKSFYKCSDRVFRKSSKYYDSSRTTSKMNLYTDEESSDVEIRKIETSSNANRVQIEQVILNKSIDNDDNKNNDDFGDFVGASSPSNNFQPTTSKLFDNDTIEINIKLDASQNGDLLFDIFGESAVTTDKSLHNESNPTNPSDPNNLKDIFLVTDFAYSTQNQTNITNSAFDVPNNNNNPAIFFDNTNFGNIRTMDNSIVTPHSRVTVDPFAIPTVNSNTSKTSLAVEQKIIKERSENAAPIDLDSLINKNIKF